MVFTFKYNLQPAETINGINLGGSDFPHALSGVVYRPSVSRYGVILLVFFVLVYIDVQMQLILFDIVNQETSSTLQTIW